ncbi:MAG: tRNA cytidylyltransferase [Gemmatimonadota bacterium]|nr:MAG: tRNA cytidylyltransferase [Gemmatimonadota bacterium]
MPFPSRLPIPDEVLAIAETLEGEGYETWCVGGAVRDNLLGLANKDFDMATAARPEEIRRLFRRSIPIGVEHGTIAVLDRHNQPHEVTTFRQDVKTDGRHAVVEFGVSLDVDLSRRDFTINAIAYHPLKHEWRDPFDGHGDLGAGVIRAVGEPERRFQEDYLRILRALRFAARFRFLVERATWEAAKANVAGLPHLSAERVRDEWLKGLDGAQQPSELVELWAAVGGLRAWLPELVERAAGNERLEALDRFEPRDAILMTAYLSDDPEATLRRLRCSNAEIDRGWRVGEFRDAYPDPEVPVEVRRWISDAGPAVDDLVTIAQAEGHGARLAEAVKAIRASGAPLSVTDLAVNGKDLMAAGVPAGPQMGETLRSLLERVLDDPALNTKEALLAVVREGTGS